MNRLLTISLVVTAGLLPARFASSQEEDVFGGKPPPAAAKPGAAIKVDPIVKTDIVLESIRDANPTTPEALTKTVQTLLDYGEPAEAKKYLLKLLATQPDADVLRGLQRKFGSAFFMQLERDQRLAPEGAQLSRAVLDSAHAAARDPQRLQELVAQLQDPSEGIRRAAVVELHDAGQAALPPLLSALADARRAAEHASLRDAMLELGELSIEPLIGALESPDGAFRARVIDVLGRLHARRAVLHLIGPYISPRSSPELQRAAQAALLRIIGDTPTQYDAEQYLFRRAKSHLNGEPPRRPNYEGWVELWHWDAQQSTAAPRRYQAQDAALIVAARAAADLYDIAPKNPDFRRLYLTTGLEMQKMVGGMSRPLPQGAGTVRAAAEAAGADVLEDLLSHAIKENYVAAAVGACEVLGDVGSTAKLLNAKGDQYPPLARALRHGDRRLRFAAAEAILRLDPREPYAGSSFVMETLGAAVGAAGVRRALVVHPQAAAAQSLVGLLNEIGFEADSAATGKRGFQMAVEGTDYELVLISDAVDRPDANELLQMLRRDPRTARLPVGLMYRAETANRMKRIAEADPLSQAMPRPHSPQSIGFEVALLLRRAGRHPMTPEERIAQASSALDRLKHLAEHADRYPFYDLLRQQQSIESALYTPELADKAAAVLGRIGSPLAQRALVGAANQNALPLAQRQVAAAGFIEAVRRRGTLLVSSEIRDQYEVYNQSETLDLEIQAVLASIIDAIESRAKSSTETARTEPGE